LPLDNLTNRWLIALGVGTVLFGLSLFVVRVPILTIIIFFAIGIPVIFLWLYIDFRSKREKEEIEALNMMEQQGCICAVCKHSEAKECFDHKCPCCISMKGNNIIGHSINPLH
jgi:membrane protein implicated in regulation of membrane protease activity